MRQQKYYRDNVIEFKTEEFRNVRCIGAIVDIEEEEEEYFYWVHCPNSQHRVSESSVMIRYIDMESGNP